MTRHLWILCALVLVLATHLSAITVDGFVYLSAQSDHSGTKVLFTERSPSAQTDSTFTDSIGHFSKVIQPGLYNVQYSHDGFASYNLAVDQALMSNTTLESATLMLALFGSRSGNLGPGDFQVTDTLKVLTGHTLTMLPGTRLFFEKDRSFIVQGTLHAIGTVTDSIVFTRRYTTHDSTWGRVRFEESEGECRMEFCVVEYALQSGIESYNTTLQIHSSTLRKNKRIDAHSYGGGGIVINGGHVTMQDCSILQNVASAGGGFYSMNNTIATIANCLFQGNEAVSGGGFFLENGDISISHSSIQANKASSGGGFSIIGGNISITYCAITEDSASIGGGISCRSYYDSLQLFIENCSIDRNWAFQTGGVYSEDASPVFNQCTMSGNTMYDEATLYFSGGSPVVSRCTISNTGGGAIAASHSNLTLASSVISYSSVIPALSLENCPTATVEYCDFFGNANGDFGGEHPLAIGQLITTNANGDSADTYYNIFRDPMFVNATAGDYHLLAGSPCINAGDPELPHDSDGSVADIGAYSYEPLDTRENVSLHPSAFSLSCFPNPFNPTTTISFTLPQAGEVKLAVFDVLGRAAGEHVRAMTLQAGEHHLTFDGSSLASGIYFVCLQAGQIEQTQKLILMK